MLPCDVIFNRLATKEFREAREWYSQRSPEASARFKVAVDIAVRRISIAPTSLPVVTGKYQRVRVEKYPYLLIFYALTDHDMRVVAVAHTSRRPGYWRRRQ